GDRTVLAQALGTLEVAQVAVEHVVGDRIRAHRDDVGIGAAAEDVGHAPEREAAHDHQEEYRSHPRLGETAHLLKHEIRPSLSCGGERRRMIGRGIRRGKGPEMPEWTDFFVAEVGASAALAGLVIVAISINVTRIISYPWLPGRAAETLVAPTG